MEKVIKIDLNSKDNLTEKYNSTIVSTELINYIITQSMLFSKKEDFRVIINNNCGIKDDCVSMIKEGLMLEYKKSLKRHYNNNLKEFFLIIIGIVFLFISSKIRDNIFNEVFLIIGWVPVWEAIELEFFSDVEERKKRFILKKLLNCEFITNNE